MALAIFPAPIKPTWSLLELLWPDILRLFATGAVGGPVAAILPVGIIMSYLRVGGESAYYNIKVASMNFIDHQYCTHFAWH